LNKFDKDYKHFKNPYKTALIYLKKSVFLLSILNLFFTHLLRLYNFNRAEETKILNEWVV